MPIFATTLVLNSLLSKMRLLPKQGSLLGNVTEVLCISTGLWIAMPFNCAIYPQYCEVNIDKLEPEI